MYPDLFGIEGFSMTLMIILGAILAGIVVFIYLKHFKVKVNYLDLAIMIIFTVLIGIIFAILFENGYELIQAWAKGEKPHWTWAMTFYGGLIGGVGAFLLMYNLYYVKHNESIIKDILKIAPCAIALGHGIGRIGCFLSGCCYGIETDAWFGIQFPGMDHKVIPTQLFEMIFLLVLALILGIMAFKQITHWQMVIYMFSYGIFRFIIEFFRGDERGQLEVGLSPSQYIAIIMVVGAVGLIFLYNKVIFKKGEKIENAL